MATISTDDTPTVNAGDEEEGNDVNMFEGVMHDSDAYMGPNYPYYKFIKDPTSIGMSSKGSLEQMGKNVNGLVEYVSLLVSGKSKASATGRPLGNKFFLKTGAKCVDTATQEEQERFIYINNVPSGNIPIVSSGAGVNFKEFRGLIPGTISNLNAFNPANMFRAFLSGTSPECQPITMETIDVENNRSTETQYVTLVDIQNTDPCDFPNGKNPVTGVKCRESFASFTPTNDMSMSNNKAFIAISIGIGIGIGVLVVCANSRRNKTFGR